MTIRSKADRLMRSAVPSPAARRASIIAVAISGMSSTRADSGAIVTVIGLTKSSSAAGCRLAHDR